MLTDLEMILHRWAEHTETVLDQPSPFDDTVLNELPQMEEAFQLDWLPIYRRSTLCDQTPLFWKISRFWLHSTWGLQRRRNSVGAAPHLAVGQHLEQRDSTSRMHWLIVHIFKWKGNHTCCDYHCGISFLSIAGKVQPWFLLNRLSEHVLIWDVLPKSQCDFLGGCGTTDMIFTDRFRRNVHCLHRSNQSIWYCSQSSVCPPRRSSGRLAALKSSPV